MSISDEFYNSLQLGNKKSSTPINNVFSIDANSFTPVSANEIIVPSIMSFNKSIEMDIELAGGGSALFKLVAGSVGIDDIMKGTTFLVAGITSAGVYYIEDIVADDVIKVKRVDGASGIVEETGVTATFTNTDDRKNHSAFAVSHDCVITFNGVSGASLFIKAGEAIYLNDSMVYFAFDTDVTLLWGF